MGTSDFFSDGQWNFYCDLCGKKTKSSRGVKTWDNFYVCRHHKEQRNPQDFVRGVKDDQTVPWSRPNNTITPAYLVCTLQGINAVSDWAIADCAISDYFNPSFLYQPPIACTLSGSSAFSGRAVAGCSIAGNTAYP